MPVTLKDLALAAGVTHPTVSRALRNHPRIGKETRLRIQALAREMGYKPDPALSALIAYRSSKMPPHRYGTLAVLCHCNDTRSLPPHIRETVDGIRRRAGELGFEAEVFQIRSDEAEQKNLSRILYHRGIRGIIVTPLPYQPVAFNWDKFTVVGIGENAVPLRLNYVSYDHHAAIEETYSQLKALGYKNIGFHNLRESETRNRFLFVAAYLKCRYLDGLPLAPPFLSSGKGKASLLTWLRKHRFDAVIAYSGFLDELKGTEFEDALRPGVAGFATSRVKVCPPTFSSYRIDGERLGAVAVDFVQTLMHQNQCGIPEPENQHSMLVRGYWQPGQRQRDAGPCS